jgi:preprotein translocase subunit SecF
MELFPKTLTVDFVALRRPAYGLSIALILISLLSLGLRGLNFGVDFTGGTLVELGFPKAVDTQYVSGNLKQAGFAIASVQHFGTNRDLLVRMPPAAQVDKVRVQDQLVGAFDASSGPVPEVRRVEFVGSQVGAELVEDGGIAVVVALFGIAVYIWLRFERRFALGALAATVHDPILIVGYFSLTGTEFDLTVLAAILAVVGYSVNDTIVIYDRIRENFRKMRRTPPADVVNASVNQTMSRTVITGGTTILTVIAMFLFGGPLLHGFSLALIIGIVVGTYSSIYVAGTVALDLGVSRIDVMPIDKETGKPKEEP